MRQSLSQSNPDLHDETEQTAQSLVSHLDYNTQGDVEMDQSEEEAEDEDPELNESHDLDDYLLHLEDSHEFASQNETTPEPTARSFIASSEDKTDETSADDKKERSSTSQSRKVIGHSAVALVEGSFSLFVNPSAFIFSVTEAEERIQSHRIQSHQRDLKSAEVLNL